MTTYLPRNEIVSMHALLSRRAGISASIVALHGLAAYLLATGMIHTHFTGPPERVQLLDLPSEKSPPPPPLPPMNTRDFKPHPLVLPDPGMPQYETTDTISDSLPPPVGPTAPVVPTRQEPIRLTGHHQLPNTSDFYPPSLVRLGIEGATDLRVCVDEHAAIQGTPNIERSSGDPRLDQGAINLALHGRYALAMRGDTPVPNCYRFRIAFRLQKGSGP